MTIKQTEALSKGQWKWNENREDRCPILIWLTCMLHIYHSEAKLMRVKVTGSEQFFQGCKRDQLKSSIK